MAAGLNLTAADWVRVINKLDEMATTVGSESEEVPAIYDTVVTIDRRVANVPNTTAVEILLDDKSLALVESVLPV